MPKDRGDYAAIYRVMVDSPEWRRLSRDARDIFYALKLSSENNITGVFLASRDLLVERSAVPLDLIEPALDELVRQAWIIRDDGYTWIRNQLRFDPSFTPENEKQLKGLFKQLDGIPQAPLKAAFVRYYQALGYLPESLETWCPHRIDRKTGKLLKAPEDGRRATSATKDLLARFPQATYTLSKGYRRGIDDPSMALPPVSVSVAVSVTTTSTTSSSSTRTADATPSDDPDTLGRAPEEEDGHERDAASDQPANGNGPACPLCGIAGSLMRERRDRPDPGWFCRSRKGGCGSSIHLGHERIVDQLSDRERRAVIAELNERHGVDVERAIADSTTEDEVKAFFEYDERTVNDLAEDLHAFVMANGGAPTTATPETLRAYHEVKRRWAAENSVPVAVLVMATNAMFYVERRREAERAPPDPALLQAVKASVDRRNP